VVPRIYLTGRIAVELDGELALDERRLPGRQGRLAFAYLVINNQHPVPRANLIDVLWGDNPPRELDVTLNAVLSRLRSLLKKGSLDAGVEVQQGQVSLRLPAGTWVDVEAAANAIDEAEGAQRRRAAKQAWSHANVAAVIARRPFLPTEEAPWIEARRQKLTAVLVRGLHCLSTISADAGELPVAIQYAGEILEIEPYRETAYQHLMTLHARMGNAAEALRVFATCRERLRDELGASPSAEMERLHLSILRGEPLNPNP
jgi:DNA-binding SARP family transcriptional activator